jgi:hypothetical protein
MAAAPDTTPRPTEPTEDALTRFRVIAGALHADGALRKEERGFLTRYAQQQGISEAERRTALDAPPDLDPDDWTHVGDPHTLLQDVVAACLEDGVLRRSERDFIARVGDALSLDPTEVRQCMAAGRDRQFTSSQQRGPTPAAARSLRPSWEQAPIQPRARRPDTGSELRVVLDKDSRTYAVGEEVRGRVVVRCPAERRCSALTVQPVWEVVGPPRPSFGAASTSRPAGDALTLCTDERWAAGSEHEYPFCLPAPAGPLTYHGRAVHLSWRLEARADVPLALDPKASAGFSLELGDDAPAADLSHTRPTELPDHAVLQGMFLGALGALLVCAGMSPIVYGVVMGKSFGAAIIIALWLAFCGTVSVLGGLSSLRSRWGNFGLRTLRLTVSPQRCGPGGTLSCTLVLKARWATDIEAVTLHLKHVEVWPNLKAPGQKTRGPRFLVRASDRQMLELSGPRSLRRGESVTLEGELRIPDGAAPSFHVAGWSPFVAGWRCEAMARFRKGRTRSEGQFLQVVPGTSR